jgi:thioredoxin reductase (NADPH)
MSNYLVQAIATAENIDVCLRTQIVDGHGRQQLESLVLQDMASDATQTVPATALFVLIGAQPRTAWLPKSIRCDPRGFILTGADLAAGGNGDSTATSSRPPLLLETSMPGVFAAGDVRHGSVKRVAAAVGEGGIAIQSVHQYLAQLKSGA